MNSSVPERREIDLAGAALITPGLRGNKRRQSLGVVHQWRAAHGLPLNVLQMNLRNNAEAVSADAFVAQRLKRRTSIETKLKRISRLRLSELQDIGGCRAVLPTVEDALVLADRLRSSRMRHERWKQDADYIASPRRSGYRGIHLLYAYRTDNERNAQYDGLRIEVQLRSRLQHAWATAVEIVGTFLGQDLKGGEGDPRWLRFFELMGTAIARKEGGQLVAGTPQAYRDWITEFKEVSLELDALNKLDAFRTTLETGPSEGSWYYLLILQGEGTNEWTLSWHSFRTRIHATNAYQEAEEYKYQNEITRRDIVLVKANSLEAIRRAYPNYFGDTDAFIKEVREVLGEL